MILKLYNNFIKLGGTNFIALVIAFFSLVVFSRFFDQDEIGIYVNFITYSSVFYMFSLLKSDILILTSNIKSKESYSYTALAFIALLIIYFLLQLFVIFLLVIDNLVNFDGMEYIPLSVFLFGFNLILLSNLQLHRHYLTLGTSKILLNSLIIIIPLTLYYFDLFSNDLIIGHVISQFFILLYNIRNIFFLNPNFFKNVIQFINKKNLKSIISKNSHFTIIESIGTFVDNLSLAFIVFSIGILGSNSDVANYHYANKLLVFPVAIIVTPLSQILITDFSTMLNKKTHLYNYVKKILIVLLPIGCIIFSVLFFFNQIIVETIYGDNWDLASFVLKYFSITNFFIFIISPISVILLVKQRYYLNTGWKILRLLSFLILFAFLQNYDLFTYLIYLTIIDLFFYFIYSILIYRTFKLCAE